MGTHIVLIDRADGNFSPDDAIFKYRENIIKNQLHDLKELRKIIYLQGSHKDYMVRRNVYEVVGELPNPDIEFLWQVIKNDESNVVIDAVEGLCHSGEKSAYYYLIRLLKDNRVSVRGKAAECLGDFNDATAINALDQAFKSEENELIKIRLSLAITQLNDNRYIGFLKDKLQNSKNSEIRKLIAQGILYRQVFEPEELNKLIQRESNLYVKVWLIGALVKNGDTASISELKRLFNDKKINSQLQFEIAHILVETEDYEYIYPYLVDHLQNSRNPLVREKVIEDLVYFKEYPLTPILGKVLMTDENIIVREIAAWALGERKQKEGIVYLEKGLNDGSAFVRTGVIAAIYKILSSSMKK